MCVCVCRCVYVCFVCFAECVFWKSFASYANPAAHACIFIDIDIDILFYLPTSTATAEANFSTQNIKNGRGKFLDTKHKISCIHTHTEPGLRFH